MDEYNIREKHIKLTALKMDYTILKSSKKDELDYWNKSIRYTRKYCRQSIEANRRKNCRTLERKQLHIDLV